ncbi:unnamed protein product [Chrysodeixis includens]|uniref:Serpin domain-containing protein n=1 Tax=Chrysodeixis includens TaxID=689277 RepID=A0A9P0FWH5_CHRIL|nr:unnamed protein product [Chrysodeixis includens]
MKFTQFAIVVTLWSGVLGYDYHCSKRSALLLLKRPAYEFSVKMLQRVTQDTDSHFVYSPLSTWLQLTALAEGATGSTLREIWNVTRHHRNKCFKRKLSEILDNLNSELRYESKRKSVMAIDRLIGVKSSYVRAVQKLYGIKVMLLDFSEPTKSADKVNKAIEDGTGAVIDRIVYFDDFIDRMLLMSDANYFRSEWKTPFNPAYTTLQPFYSNQGLKIGEVPMMNQIGYYHYVDVARIKAKVLEIPCASRRISMLIFMPTVKGWIGEIFYSLQNTRLTGIFNMYKKNGLKLINVTMPVFSQQTEIDNLPELVYDMGIKKIFNPDIAEFKSISDYKIYASLMTQVTDIEVNEKGISVETANFLVNNNDTVTDFLVDKPFAYMIVDRLTEFILFAGVYSKPGDV